MNLTLKSLLKLAVIESSLLLLLLKSSLSKNSSLFLKIKIYKKKNHCSWKVLYQKRINRYQYCKVQSNTNILKSMHHMCDVSPSVDMFTYCGDDWYNDMCGDVCMSIWISTYCGDVCNMEIVWVGGGMVIACHVMPPHTKAVMAFSQQVLVPTSLPLKDLHFFSQSHSLWEAPS